MSLCGVSLEVSFVFFVLGGKFLDVGYVVDVDGVVGGWGVELVFVGEVVGCCV